MSVKRKVREAESPGADEMHTCSNGRTDQGCWRWCNQEIHNEVVIISRYKIQIPVL